MLLFCYIHSISTSIYKQPLWERILFILFLLSYCSCHSSIYSIPNSSPTTLPRSFLMLRFPMIFIMSNSIGSVFSYSKAIGLLTASILLTYTFLCYCNTFFSPLVSFRLFFLIFKHRLKFLSSCFRCWYFPEFQMHLSFQPHLAFFLLQKNTNFSLAAFILAIFSARNTSLLSFYLAEFFLFFKSHLECDYFLRVFKGNMSYWKGIIKEF